MRSEAEAQRALELYADTVRRVCFIYLKNYADVDDIFQEVFLKYILYDKEFESNEHERAWLIRVSINTCKDSLKSSFRKNIPLESLSDEPSYIQENDRELWESILELPQKYRDTIYLFYYEGYTAVEIAEILGKKENTIYTWLNRARERLKAKLGGEPNGQ